MVVYYRSSDDGLNQILCKMWEDERCRVLIKLLLFSGKFILKLLALDIKQTFICIWIIDFTFFNIQAITILYLYQLGMLTIFRAFRWWKIRPTMAGSNLILKRRFVERFAKFVLGCTNEKRFELNIALWS